MLESENSDNPMSLAKSFLESRLKATLPAAAVREDIYNAIAQKLLL